jgi:hydroxyethylthiazole kinase-like uncharacterized protein yjeF
MERAGTAAAHEITRRYPEQLKRGAVVFTGSGNNGGDGWVVAGNLARTGVDVTVVEVAAATAGKSPDAIAMKAAAIDAVRTVYVIANSPGIVVDAILGTGFSGVLHGPSEGGIETVNQLRSFGARVVALDVPSGLDATTGEDLHCVVADLTLSFGSVKRGTLLARDCCGEIVALDIGLGDAADGGNPSLPVLVDGEWVRSRIPPIRYDAHKGTKKHLAIVGGGKGMPGAVVLAARGALRSGIGLVRVLADESNVSAILAAVPSALISGFPSSSAEIESAISKWADAVVIGPGLGKSKQSRALIEQILSSSTVPVILDADALNLFEGDASSLGVLLAGRSSLITPHPAEFARLAHTDVKTVHANLFDIGLDLARTLGATVLLKGSPTVISTPNGERYVVARGTAALGTGGSGDLLDGIAGTILAQTGDAVVAAGAAAWIHGRAAELCEYVRGTTLDDIVYALPRAWNELEPPVAPPVLAELPAVVQ